MIDIETSRLFINELTFRDAKFIMELLNTESWKKHIGDRNIGTIQQAERYIQKIRNTADMKYWVVFRKTDKTPLGIVTFIKRAYLEHHDIGFAFLPQFTGQGYAIEAVQRILTLVRETFALKTILAIVKPDNDSSIKLLEKIGFIPDQTTHLDESESSILIFRLFVADAGI